MLNLAVVVPFITAYSQRIQDLAKGGRHRVYCPSPDAEVGGTSGSRSLRRGPNAGLPSSDVATGPTTIDILEGVWPDWLPVSTSSRGCYPQIVF
jgi:hypothetical protein